MARVWSDLAIGAGLALGAFALYFATLLPGLGSRDTAELQWVVPTLGLAHPTGYPLYTILGWLWCQLPLGGTPAWRTNLFSAFAAALAIGTVYQAARAIGQARLVAAAAALALATSLTFWSQATIAEVYGLAALLQALLILALLRWRAGVWPLWPIGLLVGLGLAHHRSVVLMLPGALAFMLIFEKGGLEGPRPSKNLFSGRSRPRMWPRPAKVGDFGGGFAAPAPLSDSFRVGTRPRSMRASASPSSRRCRRLPALCVRIRASRSSRQASSISSSAACARERSCATSRS